MLNLLGLRSVPIIDVNGAKNWKQVQSVLIDQGFAHYIDGEWVKYPVALSNHILLQINGSFLEDVSESQGVNHFSSLVDNCYTLPSKIKKANRESRCYQQNQCSESTLNSYSSCISFTMDSLVNYNLP